MPKKSLADTHPEVAKQWHPTKNGELTPNDFTKASNKKVWWKCPEGDDHEYLISPNKRVYRNQGCRVCSGRKIVKSNCLATLNPELAKQWHPTKNGDLTTFDVGKSSDKKVWWKCPEGDDHEWESTVGNRARGNGCAVCSGHKLVKSNCLATLNPELAKQWHPTKNGDLTPFDVTEHKLLKVWWKCPKGDDHEWKSSINNRSKGNGCSVCDGKTIVKSNCLATTHPELAEQWHPTKNGNSNAYNIGGGSGKRFWWKCDKGDDHEWITSPSNRINKGAACAICINQKIVKSNCLATTHPELAEQWHPTKNGRLTTLDVGGGTHKKVWWKCPKGDDHEWTGSVINRTRLDRNCPVCVNQKIVKSNCMATTHPELAKQWHPTKNGDLTPFDVGGGTNLKIWWKCPKGDDHEWITSASGRSGKRGCPFCTLTPQSKQELTITFELMKLFKNIDPKGLKTKLEGRLRAIDIFIPKLNLCIEFDGSYWHKDKRDIDKIKSEMLFKEGFKLIRVREEPLKKIYDTDIISKKPYNGKQVTNDILSMIMSMFELDTKLVSKIKEYQSKDGLQNEKGLDRYIDKILTEKAERNN